jgi:hypothetical protein
MKYMLFTYRDPSVQLDLSRGRLSRLPWLPGVKRWTPVVCASWGTCSARSRRAGRFGVERARRWSRMGTGVRFQRVRVNSAIVRRLPPPFASHSSGNLGSCLVAHNWKADIPHDPKEPWPG